MTGSEQLDEVKQRLNLRRLGLPPLAALADREPWQFYSSVNESGGVVWDDELGAWLVGSYELMRQIGAADGDTWLSRDLHGAPPAGMTRETWRDFVGFGSLQSLHTTTDMGEHDRMHRWWMRTFSGRALRHLGTDVVRPIAHEILDGLAPAGRADLCADYAMRVAPRAVAAAMALPWAEKAWFDRYLELHRVRIRLVALHRSGEAHSGNREGHADIVRAGLDACAELNAMMSEVALARQPGDGTDIISMLWHDAPTLFPHGFTADDIVAAANVVFSGATGTTSAATANGIYILLSDPATQAVVRTRGERGVTGLVEEALRLFGPHSLRIRVAAADTRLGDVVIREGEAVIALTVAAGRDARHYPEASTVDLDRSAPRDHLGFQYGRRSCPGQGLARTQLNTVFTALLERLSDLRMDQAAAPPRYAESFVRFWRPLNATFVASAGS